MANYNEIKTVIPSQSRLVVAVGGRTGKLGGEVVRRLDEEDVHENETAQDHRLCLRSVETLKARSKCEEGSLE